MTRVGLVLGAGGTVGQAYEAGVLAALEHDLGWDPRTADVVVGTSAGSVTGSLLRLGVPAADLAAWAVQAPLSVEGARLEQALAAERPAFPPLTPSYWLRPWRLPSPALIGQMARRPWAVRPTAAALTLAPRGRVDLLRHTSVLGALAGDTWPEGLYVCVARRSDGRRTVLGRHGAPAAQLPEGVAASCAIPGYFSPVVIDGVEYFDGGVHSPTNADVLRGSRLDLVIVVAPMSIAAGARSVDLPVRRSARRRLDLELRRLQREGTAVVRFEPGPTALRAMGVNLMAPDRSDRVVQAAFLEAGGQAAALPVARAMAAVRRRSRTVASARDTA